MANCPPQNKKRCTLQGFFCISSVMWCKPQEVISDYGLQTEIYEAAIAFLPFWMYHSEAKMDYVTFYADPLTFLLCLINLSDIKQSSPLSSFVAANVKIIVGITVPLVLLFVVFNVVIYKLRQRRVALMRGESLHIIFMKDNSASLINSK